jgi:hypothetical protein
MYTEAETEDDHFPVRYRWELEQYQELRPYYYHIWYCPHCHFAEEKEVFRGEDTLDGKLEMLKDKLLIESRRPNGLMSRLGEQVDYEQSFIDWSSALAAHILAIFIQEQLSPNMRLNGKLARLYLRTAWLYREQQMDAIRTAPSQTPQKLARLLEDLKEEWPEGPFSEEAAMSQAVEYYKLELENAGRADNIRHEISLMFLLASLYLRLDQKREAYGYVRMIFQQATRRRASVQKALEGGVRRGKLNERQIEHMKSLLQWLKNKIEQASAMADQVSHAIFKDEYPEAQKMVLKMGEVPPDFVLKKLREAGFFEGTCRRVATIYKKKLLDTDIDDLEAAESAADQAARKQKNKGFFGRIADMVKGEEEGD